MLLSFAFTIRPDNGGTMPGKNHTVSAHVDPGSPPFVKTGFARMVEAPGTAPGSVTGSEHDVYRHSRFPGTPNIMFHPSLWKGRAFLPVVTRGFGAIFVPPFLLASARPRR